MEFSFGLMGFLVVFPLIVAAALLFVRQEGPRRVIVCVSGVAIALASVVLVVMNLGASCTLFAFESMAIDYVCTAVTVAHRGRHRVLRRCATRTCGPAVLAGRPGGRHARPRVRVSPTASTCPTACTSTRRRCSWPSSSASSAPASASTLSATWRTSRPTSRKARRTAGPTFFALMFVFLSGHVRSSCSPTTCSGCSPAGKSPRVVLLPPHRLHPHRGGHRQRLPPDHHEPGRAASPSWRRLYVMRASRCDTLSFLRVPRQIGHRQPRPWPRLAGHRARLRRRITKAAQMPFHTWLLGAMVAPTPTSGAAALLHHGEGRRLLCCVKLAPIVLRVSPAPAVMVILVGGLTLRCCCSFMAISQSNAKRVLAYSTIANLGLIAACAGRGHRPRRSGPRPSSCCSMPSRSRCCFCASAPPSTTSAAATSRPWTCLFEPHAAPSPLHDARHPCACSSRPFGMLLAKRATLVSFADTRQVALIVHLGLRHRRHVHVLGQVAREALRHRRASPRTSRPQVHAERVGGACMLMAVPRSSCACVVPAASSRGALVEPYVATACYGTARPGHRARTTCGSPPSVAVHRGVPSLFAGLGTKHEGRDGRTSTWPASAATTIPAPSPNSLSGESTEAIGAQLVPRGRRSARRASSPVGAACSTAHHRRSRSSAAVAAGVPGWVLGKGVI